MFRSILCLFLAAVVLNGCLPPQVNPVPQPGVQPVQPVPGEISDPEVTAKVVGLFAASPMTDKKSQAKLYCALYTAAADAIESDKSIVSFEKAIADVATARSRLNLRAGTEVAGFGTYVSGYLGTDAGQLTETTRPLLVRKFRNLAAACRAAAN